MDSVLVWLQHAAIFVQHTFLSSAGREYLYLIFLLYVALIVSTEHLRTADRKLRNRHDREVWGRRPAPDRPA